MAQRILLDTQTALWVIRGSSSLGKGARALITGADIVAVSTISIAENEIKRMKIRGSDDSALSEVLAAEGYSVLDFTVDAANSISRFGSLVGHDPQDRMILAHAAAGKYDLLTSDSVLLGLGFDWILDARV